MKKVLVLYMVLLMAAVPLFAQEKVSTRLQDAMNNALDNNASVRALVMLRDRVDIEALDQELYARKATLQDRAFTVITTLQAKADETQPGLLNWLKSKSAVEVIQVERFWVANMLMVEAIPAVLVELSKNMDVAYMDLDAVLQLDEPVERVSAPQDNPNGIEPGLAAINAPAMWQAGFTGNGVIVMGIDTGVDGTHPALSYKWRGNQPGVPASAAWFDPNTGSPTPTDCDNHGTHTIGTMNGLDPANNDTIGVAFGAQWIAAKTLCAGSHTSASIAAFQWAMDPDGNPSTSDDMPVGIGNSWWDPDITSSTQCDPNINPYINVLTAVEAAGIGVVFSAGNNGPSATSVTAPKNVNLDEVHFWATGAVDGNNPSFPIASFSSRGPVVSSCLTGVPSLDIKPEASAPGVSVRSSIIGGGYSFFSGTSMACPHVVGALALLREAHPNRTGAELKMALYQTAVDLGAVGEDNDYGMGIIDVWAAHLSLQDPLDPKAPENFVTYSDYLTPTSMALSWDDPTNYENGDTLLAANFVIEIERDGTPLTTVNGGVEGYNDTGLNDGQLYNYLIYTRVTASDSTSMEVTASWHAGGSPVPGAPANLQAVADTMQAVLTWTDPTTQEDGTPLDDLDSIYVYRDGSMIAAVAPGVETYTDVPPPGFFYNYTVVAKDNETPPNLSAPSNTAGGFIGTTPNFLVWVGPDAAGTSVVSGDSIFAALVANGESAFLTNNLFEFGNDLSIYEGVFVVLGIYSNNHVIGSADPEGPALETYLSNGGRVYLEGGDCFNYDPEVGGYQIRPWFGLDDGPDGSADLAGVVGLNDLSAFSFAYNGENNFMDELQALTSTPVWQNNANADISGVFNVFGAGRAIGVVPSFGGFVSSAEALNTTPRIAGNVEPNDAYYEETYKPRAVRGDQLEFVKKAAWYPELKKSQAQLDEVLKWTPGGPYIEANTQEDLMAAYVGLFRAQPVPPVIGITDTVFVDTLLVGATLDNSTTISNVGGSFADSLFFTIVENPAVSWLSVAPAADTLLANQSSDITISLDAAGLTSGNYTTTLEVSSNDPNHPLRTISVTLYANDAPMISISPDTFDVTLSGGQTATDTLTISNLGAGPLNWEISAGGVRPELMWFKFDETGQMVAQNSAAPATSTGPANLFGAMSMGGTGQTGAALIGTGGSSGTDYVTTNWATNLGADSWTIEMWINNAPSNTDLNYLFGDPGATSFRCFIGGAAGAGNLLLRGPIADVVVTGVAPGPSVVTFVYDNTVPEVRAYVNGVLNTTVAQSGVNIVGAGPFKIGSYSTSAGMTAGMLMDNFKLFNQAVDPGTEEYSRQEWLTFNPSSGILDPGFSADVTLTFDPTGLVGGDYTEKATVTSNDPVNPEVSAGVHLLVIGQAVVGHSPDTVVMNTTFTGGVDSSTFYVKNSGSDSLRVSDITSTNAVFSVAPTSFTVAPPLDSVEVTVYFNPTVVGTESGYLLVASNDPVTPVDSVMVEGEAVAAPVAGITPSFTNPVQVAPDDSTDIYINLTNSGGSPLIWSASASNAPGMERIARPVFGPVEVSGYADVNPDSKAAPAGFYLEAMWDLQANINLETVTGALGNAGAEFDGTYYYSTRWASNLLHKIDLSGNLVEEFSISGVTGLRDLAFDGTFMYGGAAANTIYVMDFATKTLIGTIPSPVAVRFIAYDEGVGGLWVGTWADNPTLIDMSGNTLATLTSGLAGQYGSAYDGYSEGGPYLWMFDQGAGAGLPQLIHQFNLNTLTATGVTHDVLLELGPNASAIAGGLWVAEGIAGGTASIGGVLQGTPDVHFAYELTATAPGWIWVMSTSGSIDPGDAFDLPVRVYGTASAVDTAYVICLTNDPSLSMASIMVARDVVTGIGDVASLPTTFDISQNYPNPFNPTTTIKYQLPQVSDVRLQIYNVLGQRVRTLVNARVEAGYHQVVWDGLNEQGSAVASGVYIYRFEAGDYQKTMKLMLLK